MQAIAKGRTNTEIAAELFISLSTVKSHLASLHNKLGVRDRVEIASWAWETGLARHLFNRPHAGHAGDNQPHRQGRGERHYG